MMFINMLRRTKFCFDSPGKDSSSKLDELLGSRGRVVADVLRASNETAVSGMSFKSSASRSGVAEVVVVRFVVVVGGGVVVVVVVGCFSYKLKRSTL